MIYLQRIPRITSTAYLHKAEKIIREEQEKEDVQHQPIFLQAVDRDTPHPRPVYATKGGVITLIKVQRTAAQ